MSPSIEFIYSSLYTFVLLLVLCLTLLDAASNINSTTDKVITGQAHMMRIYNSTTTSNRLASGLNRNIVANYSDSKNNNKNTIQTSSDNQKYDATSKRITNILNYFFNNGYDKRVRPNYGGAAVDVNVTMRILSISSVSEVQMDFTADFYFRQKWNDPRLRFKPTANVSKLFVGEEVSKKIWIPDTFFGNEKNAYFHEATTPNVFLRINYDGAVYRSIRLTVTSSCPMKLQYFPMDRQSCTIEAESYGYNHKDIIYHWGNIGGTAVEKDDKISLPQFDIIRTEQKSTSEVLSSGTYSHLIAEIYFARRMGYYLIQIYIPSSLIVVISWVSFWLHRNASPARVQLGVTTVLTMTTLMSSTNAALPKISYVKSIDVFLGTCFVMVFAALIEYASVGYLAKRIAMRKAQATDAYNHAVALTQKVATQNPLLIQQNPQQNQKNPTDNYPQKDPGTVVEQLLTTAASLPRGFAYKHYPASRIVDSSIPYRAHKQDSIFGFKPSTIDKYSRALFPVVFVCFQLMYWIVYLHISAFLEDEEAQH